MERDRQKSEQVQMLIEQIRHFKRFQDPRSRYILSHIIFLLFKLGIKNSSDDSTGVGGFKIEATEEIMDVLDQIANEAEDDDFNPSIIHDYSIYDLNACRIGLKKACIKYLLVSGDPSQIRSQINSEKLSKILLSEVKRNRTIQQSAEMSFIEQTYLGMHLETLLKVMEEVDIDNDGNCLVFFRCCYAMGQTLSGDTNRLQKTLQTLVNIARHEKNKKPSFEAWYEAASGVDVAKSLKDQYEEWRNDVRNESWIICPTTAKDDEGIATLHSQQLQAGFAELRRIKQTNSIRSDSWSGTSEAELQAAWTKFFTKSKKMANIQHFVARHIETKEIFGMIGGSYNEEKEGEIFYVFLKKSAEEQVIYNQLVYKMCLWMIENDVSEVWLQIPDAYAMILEWTTRHFQPEDSRTGLKNRNDRISLGIPDFFVESKEDDSNVVVTYRVFRFNPKSFIPLDEGRDEAMKGHQFQHEELKRLDGLQRLINALQRLGESYGVNIPADQSRIREEMDQYSKVLLNSEISSEGKRQEGQGKKFNTFKELLITRLTNMTAFNGSEDESELLDASTGTFEENLLIFDINAFMRKKQSTVEDLVPDDTTHEHEILSGIVIAVLMCFFSALTDPVLLCREYAFDVLMRPKNLRVLTYWISSDLVEYRNGSLNLNKESKEEMGRLHASGIKFFKVVWEILMMQNSSLEDRDQNIGICQLKMYEIVLNFIDGLMARIVRLLRQRHDDQEPLDESIEFLLWSSSQVLHEIVSRIQSLKFLKGTSSEAVQANEALQNKASEVIVPYRIIVSSFLEILLYEIGLSTDRAAVNKLSKVNTLSDLGRFSQYSLTRAFKGIGAGTFMQRTLFHFALTILNLVMRWQTAGISVLRQIVGAILTSSMDIEPIWLQNMFSRALTRQHLTGLLGYGIENTTEEILEGGYLELVGSQSSMMSNQTMLKLVVLTTKALYISQKRISFKKKFNMLNHPSKLSSQVLHRISLSDILHIYRDIGGESLTIKYHNEKTKEITNETFINVMFLEVDQLANTIDELCSRSHLGPIPFQIDSRIELINILGEKLVNTLDIRLMSHVICKTTNSNLEERLMLWIALGDTKLCRNNVLITVLRNPSRLKLFKKSSEQTADLEEFQIRRLVRIEQSQKTLEAQMALTFHNKPEDLKSKPLYKTKLTERKEIEGDDDEIVLERYIPETLSIIFSSQSMRAMWAGAIKSVCFTDHKFSVDDIYHRGLA